MKSSIFLVIMALILPVMLNSCMEKTHSKATNTEQGMSNEEYIARGEYLVTTIGCNDCHSPKRMGPRGPEIIPELMLSGYSGHSTLPEKTGDVLQKGWGVFNEDLTTFAGPWGQSFAGNLTPDPTGIGTWSQEQFKKALTQGKFKGIDGGRMILPPMPWQNWANMKDEDVKAIYLYLKSIPPVKNVVPPPVPPENLMAKK